MMNKIKLTITLCMFGVLSIIRAQEPEFFTRAIDTSHEEVAVYDYEAMGFNQQAKLQNQWKDPTTEFKYFILQPETKAGPQLFGVSAYQTFPKWKQNKLKAQIARQQAEVSYTERKNALMMLKKQALRYYYSIAGIDTELVNIMDMHSYLNVLKKIVRVQFENDRATMADLLEVEVKMKEHHAKEKRLKALRSGYAQNLKHICNLPDTMIIRPDTADIFRFNELGKNSIPDEHPELKVWEQQKEIQELQTQQVNKKGNPEFGLGLSYINVQNSMTSPPEINGKDILAPSIKLSIPLHRGKIRDERAITKIKVKQNEQKKIEVRRKMQRRLQMLQANIEAKRAIIEENLLIIEQTQEILKLYEQYYAENQIEIDRLLDTKMKVFHLIENNIIKQKEIEKLQVKIDYLTQDL